LKSRFEDCSFIESVFYIISRLSKESYIYYLDLCFELIFELAQVNNIDLLKHIELKMRYNKTRSNLHGKKY
ncbi:MAG: hypothetical protein ACRCZY_07990, partial [Phocaeicola sp.]